TRFDCDWSSDVCSSDLAREAGVSRTGAFPRLLFTRREANAIYSIAGKGKARESLDFEASKETALSPQLKNYRILHFATHGLLNKIGRASCRERGYQARS